MSLLEKRNYYKPFEYPWAFDMYKVHEQSHWMPEEVPMVNDIGDFRDKLSEPQKTLLTNIFRFFTQADVDVAGAYCDSYLNTFKPPEVRMMLSSFAAREAVHIEAYSTLIETLGIENGGYEKFMTIKAMADKHEYLNNFNMASKKDIARTLAIFSGFIEGVQLFSSFAILLNFSRFNLMKGMGQIVTWSIRDESMHVSGNARLFREYVRENPELWTDQLKYEIYCAAERVISLEDAFIDICYEDTEVPGLTKEDVKLYIRYIGDKRLMDLGLKPIFGSTKNPLEWLDHILNGVEHVNFFENRSTDYSKGASTGNWEDIFQT
jgi:ribonucleoside-diphosphate reductase beta chain